MAKKNPKTKKQPPSKKTEYPQHIGSGIMPPPSTQRILFFELGSDWFKGALKCVCVCVCVCVRAHARSCLTRGRLIIPWFSHGARVCMSAGVQTHVKKRDVSSDSGQDKSSW